ARGAGAPGAVADARYGPARPAAHVRTAGLTDRPEGASVGEGRHPVLLRVDRRRLLGLVGQRRTPYAHDGRSDEGGERGHHERDVEVGPLLDLRGEEGGGRRGEPADEVVP